MEKDLRLQVRGRRACCEAEGDGMIQRELRDELEVPGHVVMIRNMTVKEAVDRAKEIMDDWNENGFKKFNDVPEGKLKEEFRNLGTALGFKVEF
jgi:hypothetical protein